MSCDQHKTKGKQLIILVRDALDTEWQLIGAATSRSFEISNPTESTTSQATQGSIAETEFTGYSQVTMSLSGQTDNRTGAHAESGYNFASSGRLLELSSTGNRCGKFMIVNSVSGGTLSGVFTITSYSKTGEQEGLVTFDMSLESHSEVEFVGEV